MLYTVLSLSEQGSWEILVHNIQHQRLQCLLAHMAPEQNIAEQRSVTERSQSCAEVASAIRNAHDIMAHWEALLPGRVLTVPYEALVGDQVGFL